MASGSPSASRKSEIARHHRHAWAIASQAHLGRRRFTTDGNCQEGTSQEGTCEEANRAAEDRLVAEGCSGESRRARQEGISRGEEGDSPSREEGHAGPQEGC